MPNLTRREFTMGNLVTAIAIAGCRNSDGTPVSSGYVFLYSPGTTTIVPGYKDDALTQVWTTVGGGIPLDAAGRANIWVSGKVDVVVTNASGQTVTTMLGFNAVTANTVEVENAGFTGAITDAATGAVSQGAGGLTDLDTVLTSLYTSLGGTDGKYLESAGATPVNIADFLRSIWITPENFGAVGNGIVDDTSACQAALSECKRLGGGVVYFSRTYKISSPLALTGATGITLLGAGPAFSSISQSVGSTNALNFTTCTGCGIRNLGITAAVTWTTCTDPFVDNSIVETSQATGMSFSGGANARISHSSVLAQTAAVTMAGVDGASTTDSILVAGSGVGLTYSGATASTYVSNVSFSGATGVLFASGLSGAGHVVVDSPSLGNSVGTAFDLSALSVNPGFYQSGNGVDQATYSAAIGNTLTIKLSQGFGATLKAASGGAGTMAVAAPTPTPNAGSGNPNPILYIAFVNAAGGDVMWSLDSSFVLAGGVAIPSTDGHTIETAWRRDFASSKWREVSRSDTTT